MFKISPNGGAVKRLRENLEKNSTQKEMASEIGVSIRSYRDIENNNLPVTRGVFDRLAKALNVRAEHISLHPEFKETPASAAAASILDQLAWNKPQLIPRFDEEIAQATTDEAELFANAHSSDDVVSVIRTSLTDETGEYVEELFNLLNGLCWSVRDILNELSSSEEIRVRRRIRQLLVLLKGNDVWVYQASFYRRLPERQTVAPANEPAEHKSRLVVAFGPPGEYGETTMRVPVDNGQPFILPPIDEIVGRKPAVE